jgi:hypothetical protein
MPIELTAYRVSTIDNWTLTPAPPRRDWMDQTREKFAYRCLPLVMANHAGWIITSPLSFMATWDGGKHAEGLKLRFPDGEGRNARQINSHFGEGVLTFSLPWLFRTSPGYGLWVRGPSNSYKDGATPLDGIVETDWAPYTFTMNWRITKKNQGVFFQKGEAIAMLIPIPLGMLEDVTPTLREIGEDERLRADFEAFKTGRSGALDKLKATSEAVWQMDYMRGKGPDGTPAHEHRRAFHLREFSRA